MTRKTALKTLAMLCTGFLGKPVRSEVKTNNAEILADTNSIVFEVWEPKSMGIIWNLDQYTEITVNYKGKTKTISPKELFEAL